MRATRIPDIIIFSTDDLWICGRDLSSGWAYRKARHGAANCDGFYGWWGARNRGTRGHLQSWGYPIRLLNGEEVEALEPRLTPGVVTAASYTDIEGHADTGAVVGACVERLKEWGADIFFRRASWGWRVQGQI